MLRRNLTVTCGVDVIRQFRYRHLEPGLNIIHDSLIRLRGYKCDRKSLRSKTACTTRNKHSHQFRVTMIDSSLPHAMQVAVGVCWSVVVDDNVHSLYIYTTTENIRCDQNSLFEVFELLVTSNAS